MGWSGVEENTVARSKAQKFRVRLFMHELFTLWGAPNGIGYSADTWNLWRDLGLPDQYVNTSDVYCEWRITAPCDCVVSQEHIALERSRYTLKFRGERILRGGKDTCKNRHASQQWVDLGFQRCTVSGLCIGRRVQKARSLDDQWLQQVSPLRPDNLGLRRVCDYEEGTITMFLSPVNLCD